MRFLFWNIRGIGKDSRRRQVREFIEQHKLGVVGLQETIKDTFSDRELRDLAGNREFTWKWLPAQGRSGGILMGVDQSFLELEDVCILSYCISMTIRDRRSNFRWMMVTVYGPVNHDFSNDFLAEIGNICEQAVLPIIIGGDFNLIREEADKNSGNYNYQLMDAFNNFIGDHQLRELKRSGQKFTWTNKQDRPILVNLDRVFFSMGWEERYPFTISWCLTRVGSDHSPILVDNGESLPVRPRYFYFDQQWLLREDFRSLVTKVWQEAEARRPENCYSLECWHGCLVFLRTKLKGWNIRKMGDQKQEKMVLMGELQEMDKQAELRDFLPEEWNRRYHLERQLEKLYEEEELYWRQRIGKFWLQAGDSNPKFFHQFANGRRRNSTIIQLETGQGVVTEFQDIMDHVVQYYKNLFGPVEARSIFFI